MQSWEKVSQCVSNTSLILKIITPPNPKLDALIAEMDCSDKLQTLFVGYFVVQFIPVGEYVDWLFLDLRRSWFMEFDTKPIEKLEVVAKDIPNLVDDATDIDFHDQLVR